MKAKVLKAAATKAAKSLKIPVVQSDSFQNGFDKRGNSPP